MQTRGVFLHAKAATAFSVS